jgi:hypothetical protein
MRLVVLRLPWLTRSVIRAPFNRVRFLRAAGVRRSLTVTVPARLAVAEPVATTTGFPLRPRTFAGTVPESFTLPARATLTLIGTPLALASALVVTLLGKVTSGPPPPPPPPGGPAGALGDAGRNAAMFAPPIAP